MCLDTSKVIYPVKIEAFNLCKGYEYALAIIFKCLGCLIQPLDTLSNFDRVYLANALRIPTLHGEAIITSDISRPAMHQNAI